MYLKHVGIPITDEDMHEVAIQSGVLDVPDDFLTKEFRDKCESIISVTDLTPKDYKDALIFLKKEISNL